MGPPVIISEVPADAVEAEPDTDPDQPEVGAGSEAWRRIMKSFATLLRDAIDAKNILTPYTRKRSLLALSGPLDALKLREAASITIDILDMMAMFAQIASTPVPLPALDDEGELSIFETLISGIQRCDTNCGDSGSMTEGFYIPETWLILVARFEPRSAKPDFLTSY